MEEFGASRTVIREAISALAKPGSARKPAPLSADRAQLDYLTVLNAAGNVVQHMLNGRDGVKNLYDSRVFIERALVREAAVLATKDDIAALKDVLAAKWGRDRDSLEFLPDRHGFPRRALPHSRQSHFPAIHAGSPRGLPHWEKMPRSPERNEVNFLAHKAILYGILDRDPAAAEEALRNHRRSLAVRPRAFSVEDS